MFSDLLRWRTQRPAETTAAPKPSAPKAAEALISSKGFPKFLSALANQPAPATVVDFGPVIGNNVAYLGERLACKLFIEDLTTELSRHIKAGTLDALPDTVEMRLAHGPESIDGILCWDFFDFLKKPAAQRVARHVVEMLRPGGAVMGYFAISDVERSGFMKYEIVDESSLRHRAHTGVGARHAHPNREIIRMFEGLTVAESFLLKNNSREILLRKK
jgi:hypothetical protein